MGQEGKQSSMSGNKSKKRKWSIHDLKMQNKKMTFSKENVKAHIIKSKKSLFDLSTQKGKIVCIGGALLFGIFLGSLKDNYTNTDSLNGYVANYDGGKIKSAQLYKALKNNQAGSEVVRNTISFEIADDLYGSKISKKMIEQSYNQMVNDNTLQYITTLNTQSTEESQKETVRQYLAYNYGLLHSVSVSDKEMAEAWRNYLPNAKVKLIIANDKTILENLKSELELLSSDELLSQFEELAKDNSLDSSKGETVTLSQDNQVLQSDVTDDILKTNEGQLLISTMNIVDSTTGEKSDKYVLSLIEKKESKGELKDHETELKEKIQLSKVSSDPKKTTDYIKSLFKKGDVHINDKYMKKAFEDYTK